ncbi:hypothetical protein ACU686_44775 [Yinghuangia aomiensis]
MLSMAVDPKVHEGISAAAAALSSAKELAAAKDFPAAVEHLHKSQAIQESLNTEQGVEQTQGKGKG